jgi:hypothetical protein
MAWAMPARAAQVVFTIDPAQSGHDLSAVDTSAVDPHGTYVPTSPGSMSTTLSGNFVVDFDPTTNTPTSLSFKGGQGYFRFDSALSAHTADAQLTIDFTPVTWDFDGTVANSAECFRPHRTFTLLSGSLTRSIRAHLDSSITTTFRRSRPRQWPLTIAKSGAADWTRRSSTGCTNRHMALRHVGLDDAQRPCGATAHYGLEERRPWLPPETLTRWARLTTGGVSINFSDATSGGTFSVQQLPNQTSLDQTATPRVSTRCLPCRPRRFRRPNLGGGLHGTIGTAATLVFAYDPTLLPLGFDESTLGIWHFNKLTSAWEFGGQVDTVNDTITFETTSFSPFQLGVAVPEPSSVVLAAGGLLGLVGYVWPAWPAAGRRSSKRRIVALVPSMDSVPVSRIASRPRP